MDSKKIIYNTTIGDLRREYPAVYSYMLTPDEAPEAASLPDSSAITVYHALDGEREIIVFSEAPSVYIGDESDAICTNSSEGPPWRAALQRRRHDAYLAALAMFERNK